MSVCKLYLVAAASLMNAVTVGIAITYLFPGEYDATKSSNELELHNYKAVSWFISIFVVGAILGGLIGGYLVDKVGRRGVLILTSFLFIFGWLLIAYVFIFWVVLIGRLLTGISVGFTCVATPIYLIEISVPELRGAFGSSFQLWQTFGILIVSVLTAFLNLSWLAMWGIASAMVALLVTCFIPESPKWLLKENRRSEAVSAMKFLYGTDIQTNEEILHDDTTPSVYINLTWADFYKPAICKPALVSLVLVSFQQFSGSTVTLFNTLLVFVHVGIMLQPLQINIYIAATMLIFTGISSCFADHASRKTFRFMYGFLMFLSLTVLGIFVYKSEFEIHRDFYWVPLACMVVYIAAFSVGFGPVTNLMMPEMSPVNARGIICGIGTAICWSFVFIITKIYSKFYFIVYDYEPFWKYAAFCLVICLCTSLLLPKTNGKTSRELVLSFTEQPIQDLESSTNASERSMINS